MTRGYVPLAPGSVPRQDRRTIIPSSCLPPFHPSETSGMHVSATATPPAVAVSAANEKGSSGNMEISWHNQGPWREICLLDACGVGRLPLTFPPPFCGSFYLIISENGVERFISLDVGESWLPDLKERRESGHGTFESPPPRMGWDGRADDP